MTSPERPEEKRCRIGGGAPPAAVPDDLLFAEVLPRLPIKCLVRFKSVCRAWRDAVDGGAVARRRLALTPPAMLVIPREDWHNNLAERSGELNFYRLLLADGGAPAGDAELVLEKALPGSATVTHDVVPTHCDGLVAVATRAGEVFVCNPATRELVALPPGTPSARDDACAWGALPAAIAYDASRASYVVARYFYREFQEGKDANGNLLLLNYDIGHEVFTLGADSGAGGGGGWELTGDPPHPIAFARPTCTREAIYWCADYPDEQNALVRFDLRDRVFDVLPPPPGADNYSGEQKVTELAGKLYYTDYVVGSDTAVDVWVADEVGRRLEWKLRCRLKFDDGVLGGESVLLVADDGDELLVVVDYIKLYRYSDRCKSVSLVMDMAKELVYQREDGSLLYGDDEGKYYKHHVLPYVESLVSIRARQ
ncbi:unnamed protein product [Urochloa decumbens]|uniref:F-box associated beta-propeller type 3 domain-containing protein n=1 Tax=Urochloa decumbens TaxID=240449 RepID=A0ABC9F349_9POAL